MSDERTGNSDSMPLNELSGGRRARITEMADIPRLEAAELDRLRIVHPIMPAAEVLRSFEQLQRRLLELTDGKNFVVGVANLALDSGASFVAMNLAATIALDHRRTSLLIEAGPGNDVLGRLLMLPPDYGLVDYLIHPEMDVESIIYSSRIPRLRVIPMGRQLTDMPRLQSTGMQQLLQNARARYSDRFVVLDIAGSVPLETTRALAQWCDFVVLVVPYGETRVTELRAAADIIGRDKLAGVVINRDPAP